VGRSDDLAITRARGAGGQETDAAVATLRRLNERASRFGGAPTQAACRELALARRR
jgi:hypothetical protein